MSAPLDGMAVVVTAPGGARGRLGRLLAERGADVVDLPLVAIADPESWHELDAALARAAGGAYDWVLIASVNAVERVAARLAATGATLGRARVGAVGNATARSLRAAGVRVDLVPERATGDDLVRALGDGPGAVLLPRVADGPRALPDALAGRGWTIDEVVAYRNVEPPLDPAAAARVRAGDFDVVTFTSASAVDRFADRFDVGALGVDDGDEPPRRRVACIGPTTADAARRRGLRVDVVAADASAEGVAAALVAIG
ncbi:MAG TPA: uroporphyrinogen-III synthase [Actinomycetota bacterium]|nr:uroporphyrinogen-III synthase [Actinomycetota bacterium]